MREDFSARTPNSAKCSGDSGLDTRVNGCPVLLDFRKRYVYSSNISDFDQVQEDDRVAIKGLDGLAPGKTVQLELNHADSSSHSFEVKHSLTVEQIEWFSVGSALNRIAVQQKS